MSEEGTAARFGILGPLSATVAGVPTVLRSARIRVILASLLLRPNRVISVEELVDRLWDESAPPRGARNAVQSYVMRLRKALGAAGQLVRTEPTGYSIEVPPGSLDLHRFRGRLALAEAAHAAADARAEAHELRVGLAMWRGMPLSDVQSSSIHAQEVPRLVEERLQAVERRVAVDLELDRHAEVVSELYELTEQNQFRENLWSQLMLALHRSGRRAEALAVYRRISLLLREELGVDPGESLQELNGRILAGDRMSTPSERTRDTTRISPEVPFQLPPDIPDFVGRTKIMGRIQDLVTPPTTNRLAVPVGILSGPPGVGKSALAIHAAHQMRSSFPDGQLYLNLRGYSPSPPLTVAEALAWLLRSLGVPSDRVPSNVDERGTLLRSLLVGRRVLIVLDDASGVDQVRPLLPADSTCAVLVTSRNNLYGLTAINGARRFPVDVVEAGEATMLMAGILGAERVAAEPAAVDELAAACGYLPLGLRIAAINLAGSAGQRIDDYVRRLWAGSRVDALAVDGDSQAAVRHAFDRSYRALQPDQARIFRLTALVPALDVDRRVVAVVAGVDEARAQRVLDQLAAINLIGNVGPNRFRFHDLLREFASSRAREEHGSQGCADALRRLRLSSSRSMCCSALIPPPAPELINVGDE